MARSTGILPTSPNSTVAAAEDIILANGQQDEACTREETEEFEQTPSEIDALNMVNEFEQSGGHPILGQALAFEDYEYEKEKAARKEKREDEAIAAMNNVEELLQPSVYVDPARPRPPPRPMTQENKQSLLELDCNHLTVDALVMLTEKQRAAGLVKWQVDPDKEVTMCGICETVIEEGDTYKRCGLCEAVRCKNCEWSLLSKYYEN